MTGDGCSVALRFWVSVLVLSGCELLNSARSHEPKSFILASGIFIIVKREITYAVFWGVPEYKKMIVWLRARSETRYSVNISVEARVRGILRRASYESILYLRRELFVVFLEHYIIRNTEFFCNGMLRERCLEEKRFKLDLVQLKRLA
jgi:hypothetical protein